MTLGIFLPLVLALMALTEVPIFIHWRRTGKITEGVFPVLALASVSLPFVAYVLLNQIVPEWGAIEVF